MARIAGIELQDNWKIDYALTNIKGIGWSLSEEVLKTAGVDSAKRVKELSSQDLSKIASEIDKKTIEGEVVRRVRGNIQRLQQIGSYRGIRHQRGLPSRGQRTKTNARTKRGKRRTVGAFKKDTLTRMQQTKKEDKKE